MKRKIKLTLSLLLALILLCSIYLIYYNLFYVSDKIQKIIDAKDSYYVVSNKLTEEAISNNTDDRLCYVFDGKKSELYCITNGERIECTGVFLECIKYIISSYEMEDELECMYVIGDEVLFWNVKGREAILYSPKTNRSLDGIDYGLRNKKFSQKRIAKNLYYIWNYSQ